MNIFAVVGVRVFFVAAVVMSGSRTVSCIVACSLFDEDVVDGLQICCGQLIGQIFSGLIQDLLGLDCKAFNLDVVCGIRKNFVLDDVFHLDLIEQRRCLLSFQQFGFITKDVSTNTVFRSCCAGILNLFVNQFLPVRIEVVSFLILSISNIFEVEDSSYDGSFLQLPSTAAYPHFHPKFP